MFKVKRTLIMLIAILSMATTIESSGQDNSNDGPVGITVQLPTLGVSIDADGVMSTKLMTDPTGDFIRDKLLKARTQLTADVRRRSACRKISLRRLQNAIAASSELSRTDIAIETLAGMTNIEYVFILPEQKDIVIAGPAEPWIENLAGRHVGIASGKPTLSIADLAVAIGSFVPNAAAGNWIACSINPTAKGMNRLKEFNRHLPTRIPNQLRNQTADRLRTELQQALGLADVKVHGISPKTHAAHVLIEADYRMKRLALGLENPVISELKTFVKALTGAPKDLQRWWLTPDYQCLKQSDDGMSIQFVSGGVKLQTENIQFDRLAQIRIQQSKPSRAARTYATSFTEQFQALAQVKPVFAQLRNVMDCLIAAAWIQKQSGWQLAELEPNVFVDESMIPIRTLPEITKAKCVANAAWKHNVLLLPAGGGVSILPATALDRKNLISDKGHRLKKIAESTRVDAENWWWD